MRRGAEACSRAFASLRESFTSKRFLVDTAVVLVLSWVTGLINEVWLVGMPWSAAINTRLVGTVTNLLTAGIYGWYYDVLRLQAAPWLLARIIGPSAAARLFSRGSDPARSVRFARRVYAVLIGYVAFITFQSQVYRLNLWIGGATPDQAQRAVGIATAVFPVVIEFVFSPILDAVRRYFKVAPSSTETLPVAAVR